MTTPNDEPNTLEAEVKGEITSPVIAAAKAALDANKPVGKAATEGKDETTTEEQSAEEKAAADAEAKTKAEAEAKEKEGEKKSAPESYELKFGEGIVVDDAIQTEFTDIAKAANLDQETAQKLADIAPNILAKMQADQMSNVQKVVDGWADQTRADKEIGGDKLAETLKMADGAMKAFATPELRAMVDKFDKEKNPNGTGLGNNPEFIRLMARVGKAISEDTKPVQGNEPGASRKSHADRLYGNKTK